MTTPETPIPTDTVVQPAEFSLPNYEQNLHDLGVRTGRHAAEIGQAPNEPDIKQATAAIRRVIAPAFEIETINSDNENSDLDRAKEQYWQRASRVGAEHGAKPGFEMDDYFKSSEHRSYFALKQDIVERNPEGSLGRSLIETVDLYHKTLEINPAHAATIVSELISKGRHAIALSAARHNDVSPEAATRLGFQEFIANTVPAHITKVVAEYGKGDEIDKVLAKQSFYPTFEEETDVSLAVAKEDVRALIDIFDLQNRPYNRAELHMAGNIAQLPEMQMAMLGVHERLMSMSEAYLQNHPERMMGDMASWSEIFVPERSEDGTIELLPNPKLMRAITTNVLPAVAGKLLERGVDVDEMTESDIEAGIQIASRKYKLLQSKVALFRTDPQTGAIQLGEITTVTCPANQAFPKFLSQYLGSDYAQLAGLQRNI